MPHQNGDVNSTYADVSELALLIDFKPQIGIIQGVDNFISWYRDYYKV